MAIETFAGPDVTGTLGAFEASPINPHADSTLYTADNQTTILTADNENAGDVLVFTGTVIVSNNAVLAATEGADTASFSGTAVAFVSTGTLAATEGADTASFSGSVSTSGILGATEGADTAAFAGQVAWLAVLAATEAPDTASFSGLASAFGVLAATEGTDTASFAAYRALADEKFGTLHAVEASDTARFLSGATLAAVEGGDTASFVGTVATLEIFGVLAAQEETPDFAYFEGQLIGSDAWEPPGGYEDGLGGETERTVWLKSHGRVVELRNEVERVTWLQNPSKRVVFLRNEVRRIRDVELELKVAA